MSLRGALILGSTVAILVVSCATPSGRKDLSVLEPVQPDQTVQEEAPRPAYARLSTLLISLGYEPVGMQFESDANLDLLYEVFSSTVAHQRKLKLIYTGLQMSYDAEAESITIGGLTKVTAILNYIQRNVPIQKNVPTPPAEKPIDYPKD